jgi:hypothetical protein
MALSEGVATNESDEPYDPYACGDQAKVEPPTDS